MNKKITLVVIAVLAIAGLLLFIYQYGVAENEAMLSEEEIKEVVGNQYPGTIEQVMLSNDAGGTYDVLIVTDAQEYLLQVEGTSGRVLNLSEHPLGQDSELGSTTDDTDSSDPSTGNGESKGQDDESPSDGKNRSALIGVEKAKKIAQEQFNGTVVEIELDEDDGIMTYEIEIESRRGEASVEIEAYTGRVIVVDIDLDDD